MAVNTKSDVFEADILKLIFQNIGIATIGDATGLVPSTAPGSLYVSLHTADPGETGTQTTNEVTTGQYPNYVRVGVVRSASGWAISGSQITPVAAITFAQSGSGTGATITHAGIGAASSGTGKLMYMGAVTPNITIANLVTPSLTTSSTVVED
jgi:hypothetical protein